jgi:peptidase E
VATPRIVALGGHEFRAAPDQLAVVAHLLALTGTERPRVCLLPTASGDPQEQIQSFHSVMDRFDCEPSHLSLFRREREPVDLSARLLSQDLIYVAGGSMLNLIAVWEAHGIARLLRDAWERGVLLAGQSAGAMCWFERGITASAGEPQAASGLGLIGGSLCVHYRRDPARREAYLRAVADGAGAGYALDDGAGLLFERGRAVEAFAGTRGARVVRVDQAPEGARELELRPIPLRYEIQTAADPALEELRELRRAGVGAGRLGAGRMR